MREGGPRNGVLTAIEDFVAGSGGLRLAIVPSFFGLAVVWHESAAYAAALAELLDPLDRNPIIARLEANRAYHLAAVHQQLTAVTEARDQLARQQAVLQRLLQSSAFGVAERLSRLRHRLGIAPAQAIVGKDEVRRALGESAAKNGR